MKKTIKRIAALAMALTIAGAGTSVSGVFSANELTADAATVSASRYMKRADFVSIIYKMAGSPNVSYPSVFKDLTNSSNYRKPIMWAYKNGIVSGYAGGTFGVNDPITIEQVAQILFNHAKFSKRNISFLRGTSSRYIQSEWAKKSGAIDWAVRHNLIKPADTSYTYDVTKPASEALCYEMINRYMAMK